MKHYANFKNGDEYDLIRPKSRRQICHSAEWLAQTKARYRRRERAILKREVAELVELAAAEALSEALYWEGKAAEHAAEYERMSWEMLGYYEDGEEPPERLRAAMDSENRLYSRAWKNMANA